jgi:hypothetical protein
LEHEFVFRHAPVCHRSDAKASPVKIKRHQYRKIGSLAPSQISKIR